MAVGFHFYNDHDTLPVMLEQVRRTYDGPLAMATDYMVFNVTKDDIKVRMAAIDQEIWPTDSTRPKKRDPNAADTLSDFTKDGKEPMPDLIKQIFADFNKRNGTDIAVPGRVSLRRNHLQRATIQREIAPRRSSGWTMLGTDRAT